MAKDGRHLFRMYQDNWPWIACWLGIVTIIFLTIHFWPQPLSPVPPRIRSEANFSVIYPAGYNIDKTSWNYVSDQKSVQFIAKKNAVSVVFSEQKTPLMYQDDIAAYDRFIGSLRPRANFSVPLGTVSIANFVTSETYQVVGESGILNTHGTLIIAHPEVRQPSDDDWRDIFNSLKIDK